MALVMAFAGRENEPVIARFVEVTDAARVFTKIVLVANKLVVVAFVNIAIEAPVVPIEVLLTAPPSIVRPFTTIASVTEFAGRDKAPETTKLVMLAAVIAELTNVEVVNIVLVVKVMAPPANCTKGVPVTELVES